MPFPFSRIAPVEYTREDGTIDFGRLEAAMARDLDRMMIEGIEMGMRAGENGESIILTGAAPSEV